MKLSIKNMVSTRCKMAVEKELKNLGAPYAHVHLGEIELLDDLSAMQRDQFKIALREYGMELIEDKKDVLIERIKNVVVESVHYSEAPIKIKFSVFLAEKLQYDYTYLSNIFSQATGTTVEHFVIRNKIERVKELMVYDELNLTEISHLLNYSSVAHLSNQFKKVTGLSPSHFKRLKHARASGLDEIF